MVVGNFPLMTRKEGGREEEKVGRSGLRQEQAATTQFQPGGGGFCAGLDGFGLTDPELLVWFTSPRRGRRERYKIHTRFPSPPPAAI